MNPSENNQPLAGLYGHLERVFARDTLARLLLQYALLLLIGTLVSQLMSSAVTNRQKERDLERLQDEQRMTFVDEFAKTAHRRLYLMKVLEWELRLHNQINEFRQEMVRKKSTVYYEELANWNALYMYHLISIQRLFPVSQGMVDVTIRRLGINSLTTGQPLRTLAENQLQKRFQQTHMLIKNSSDHRLEAESTVEDSILVRMSQNIAELEQVVFDYTELLFRLAMDLSNH